MMVEKQEPPFEFTEKGIPTSLRPYFQEYTLENLDPDKNAFTVVERTMAWGDLREWRWLLERFDRGQLKEFVRKYGWRLLPRRRFKFWTKFLGVTEYVGGEKRWQH